MRHTLTGAIGILGLAAVLSHGCGSWREVEKTRAMPSPATLKKHCEETIREPRVEQIADNVWVALAHDLANTILVKTSEGIVIIDAAMSPKRAKEVREAFGEIADGPVKAIVFTHSHIDHVGGAAVWVDEGTEIWATDAFREHFLKQYGLFRKGEQIRGRRQFGVSVPEKDLTCSALGRRIDMEAALETGMVFPTHTFSGNASFTAGDTEFQLFEAHGETHDQLFVWMPEIKALMPGDNYYQAFPNLYTIRGTSPRPVTAWIESLDAMRRLQPEILLPSHTQPILGAEEIAQRLRDYRDGIQWIRDQVVRRANMGQSLPSMIDEIGLPPHLADFDALSELYGQVDWSAKAIFTNQMGWFDGRTDTLYPLPYRTKLKLEIDAMGGAKKVLTLAQQALKGGDPRWAVHLLAKLRDGLAEEEKTREKIFPLLAEGYRKIAQSVYNTNGRGYLLERAIEIEGDAIELPEPKVNDALVKEIPVEIIFETMVSRLIPEKSLDALESVEFFMKDSGQRFIVTVRRGVAELAQEEPLPGTPQPLAKIETDTLTWKRLALQIDNPAGALASGRLSIEGEWLGFVSFLGRFERGL